MVSGIVGTIEVTVERRLLVAVQRRIGAGIRVFGLGLHGELAALEAGEGIAHQVLQVLDPLEALLTQPLAQTDHRDGATEAQRAGASKGDHRGVEGTRQPGLGGHIAPRDDLRTIRHTDTGLLAQHHDVHRSTEARRADGGSADPLQIAGQATALIDQGGGGCLEQHVIAGVQFAIAGHQHLRHRIRRHHRYRAGHTDRTATGGGYGDAQIQALACRHRDIIAGSHYCLVQRHSCLGVEQPQRQRGAKADGATGHRTDDKAAVHVVVGTYRHVGAGDLHVLEIGQGLKRQIDHAGRSRTGDAVEAHRRPHHRGQEAHVGAGLHRHVAASLDHQAVAFSRVVEAVTADEGLGLVLEKGDIDTSGAGAAPTDRRRATATVGVATMQGPYHHVGGAVDARLVDVGAGRAGDTIHHHIGRQGIAGGARRGHRHAGEGHLAGGQHHHTLVAVCRPAIVPVIAHRYGRTAGAGADARTTTDPGFGGAAQQVDPDTTAQRHRTHADGAQGDSADVLAVADHADVAGGIDAAAVDARDAGVVDQRAAGVAGTCAEGAIADTGYHDQVGGARAGINGDIAAARVERGALATGQDAVIDVQVGHRKTGRTTLDRHVDLGTGRRDRAGVAGAYRDAAGATHLGGAVANIGDHVLAGEIERGGTAECGETGHGTTQGVGADARG